MKKIFTVVATASSRNSLGWALGTMNILPAAPAGTTDRCHLLVQQTPSSISNRTSSYWKLYRDTNYNGPWVCIAPGDQFSSLKGPFPDGIGNHNDWISSVDKLTAEQARSCNGHTL